jgi:hypothetical protein
MMFVRNHRLRSVRFLEFSKSCLYMNVDVTSMVTTLIRLVQTNNFFEHTYQQHYDMIWAEKALAPAI